MKIYKLYTHQKSFNTADLVLNPKEHPDAKLGDVVEIFHSEDEDCKLLLQITEFNDLKGRDVISIESSIASTFNLKAYSVVVMRLVNAADVALDSIEITFKDQYMGRSEMWRLKTYLTNTCVYINKKIDYFDKSIRCQVYEMWSQGDRVSCGVITEDTKIVFRSSTSMVYLFLQMSSEMWDFDIHGDLYFEKAVNGFLTELFTKWNKLGCNHEVTIVLFSRTFYAAKSLDEFPVHMRDCLQMDYKGRFYEDFYRVAIQNERNDDWCSILMQLRKLFTSYQSTVLRYHERENVRIPTATNSTAAQGNFLEVLNISLNTFEKHYLDRSFDRTGQLSVVVTPGVGVFEVDRELTNITKQRIIDNGVGSDLVCVGEQPLHAVPLLKFHNKDTSLTSADDYSLPHWINLSFYSTNKKVAYSTFIPRIKLTPLVAATVAGNENKKENTRTFLSCNQSEYIHNSLFDYDAYDAQIFQLPPAQGTCSLQRVVRAKKTSVPSLETYTNNNYCDVESFTPLRASNRRRKMSDPDIHHGTSGVLSTLTGSPNLSESIVSEKNARRSIVSIAPIVRPGRALINPFDPSHVTIKLTSNRRRWTHIFPKGPEGVLIQQHHYQAVPTKQLSNSNHIVNGVNCNDNNNTENYSSGFNSSEYDHTSNCSSLSRSFTSSNGDDFNLEHLKKRNSHISTSATPTSRAAPAKSLTFLWGATGEQEWTPALTTGRTRIIIGVDWKSLTIPACLPITTDYFPDKRSLHNDYVISDYTLLPDDVNSDYANSRAIYRKPLTTQEVFKEIVSQRLAQGFQLIVLEDKNQGPSQAPCCGGLKQKQQSHQSSVLKMKPPSEITKEYLLSIGRIFHKISLRDSVITVTGYKPRHPYPPINVDYRYRFHAPQHDTYEISGVNFTTEKLEHFNWNYMDHYICTRGDTDYLLLDSLKYWRYRMYLLPKDIVAMNKILEHGCSKCDIYSEPSPEIAKQQIDDFLKLVEVHLNKIKRLQNRKPRDSPTAPSHLTRRRHSTSIISRAPPNQGLGNSPFRERVGSNRLPDKRPRAGTKPLERGRISPAADAAVIALNSEINVNEDRDDAFLGEIKLRPNATLMEIFEAMKHPVTGVGFFAPTQGLPSCTFVCFDALMWLKARLDESKNPLDVLESMRKERMICHASGDWNKPVVPGFYLYYIGIQDKKDFIPPLNDLCAFENEWVEVEIQGYKSSLSSNELAAQEVQNKIPNFLRNTPPPQTWCNIQRQRNIYKHSHLEIDVNNKSDRMEWGHVKYHSVMQPGHAFEMVVEWVTASGPIVYDLIYGWQRKAQQCGFQLMPVPADPLAEPFTEKSDPLRGPMFIPLNTCFLGNDEALFEEFSEETRGDRMLLFQEAILTRYGFMPCVVKNNVSLHKDLPKEYQYVHCSGNMFVLIRCSKGNQQIESPSRQEGNVTRLVYGHTSHTNVPKKVGFLWSWNHMIANKKWKSLIINCSPDGELFQLKMLKDFREFCSNQDQRLKKFWDSCYELKNSYSENGSDKCLRT
ncbi:GATOR complex protein Iml1 isoform X2 [Eupeodes corollae]|uniref:GATOR complex protein Iml1 isoform X2 n=1 Tax=Eupeodes corollae TaxID=290404 RepID=UPI00249035CD|nr:GATOR complex protein Iml1 isoform X2 [Eupeodes corollae]